MGRHRASWWRREEGQGDSGKPGKTTFDYNGIRLFSGISVWASNEGENEESTKYRITVPEGHWHAMADDRDVALIHAGGASFWKMPCWALQRLHRAEPDLWREEGRFTTVNRLARNVKSSNEGRSSRH